MEISNKVCRSVQCYCEKKDNSKIQDLNAFKEIIDKEDKDCSPFEKAIKTLKNWKCSDIRNLCKTLE